MRTRLKIILISCLSAALVFGGWTAYAATSSTTPTSTAITGKLVSLSKDTITVHTDSGDQTVPLASSVWVYLNDNKAQLSDLHTDTQLELILNNKGQAAYVKGSSGQSTEQATETTNVSDTVSPNPTAPSDQPASEAPMSSATPLPTPVKPHDTAPAAKPAGKDTNMEDMDVNVEGQHFNLHIKQNKGPHGQDYDLTIQSPHAGKLHLTGFQAQAWISNLLGSVDITAAGAQQALKQQLAKQYALDANKLNMHVKVSSSNNDNEHEKETEKEMKKPKGKEQDKDKENDNKHGNSNKHN
ncbi:hypothetical protein A8709_11855 [Paenibacillus pectinilyticus]|uniref:DUF5666 domain-containing protein n=1 Tax=Paenibacillus pectinilyticus TaxID=512399 RepID=A0A1C0ZR08_9BACL|nr:hypothetical protein [Paenibacillus pectinilyticus]OCT10490.1 hypothetical protein A8709_11855 [Paenibacillus pectinilyticus]